MKFLSPLLATLSVALGSVIATSALMACGGCAVARDQESVGGYVDDATVTARVKAKFVADDEVSAMAFGVETLKGVVQLSGFAKSEAERARAGALALSVPGVVAVTNSIRVRS
jgi:hyperosmotically inducible protein